MESIAARTWTLTWNDPQPAIDAAKTLSGIEYLRAMAAGELPGPPMAALIDMRFDEVASGRVVMSALPREVHYNPMGTVHGGFTATLLDSAMGCATLSRVPLGSFFTTLELNINFTRPMTAASGRVSATGTIIHAGSRVITSEAKLVDGAGKLIAHGTSTCMVMPW